MLYNRKVNQFLYPIGYKKIAPYRLKMLNFLRSRPLDFKTAFALTIKEIRKEKKLSQEQVANRCFCQTVIIGRLETAQREPKISTIFKIANALEVPPDYLVKKVEEKLNEAAQE